MQPTQGLAVLALPPPSASAAPRAPTLLPSLDLISGMLWAGFGRQCRASGGRAPPLRAWHDVDVYVCRADGCYRYDVAGHALVRVTSHDYRALAGWRRVGPLPPIVLLYVTGDAEEDDWEECGRIPATQACTIAANVAAYCAGRGLSTRGDTGPDPHLATLLGLHPGQRVALTQSVGAALRPH